MDCSKEEKDLEKHDRMLGNGFLSYAVFGQQAPQHDSRSLV